MQKPGARRKKKHDFQRGQESTFLYFSGDAKTPNRKLADTKGLKKAVTMKCTCNEEDQRAPYCPRKSINMASSSASSSSSSCSSGPSFMAMNHSTAVCTVGVSFALSSFPLPLHYSHSSISRCTSKGHHASFLDSSSCCNCPARDCVRRKAIVLSSCSASFNKSY